MYELDDASVRVGILEAALDIAGTRGEPAVTLEEVANSLQRPLSDIEAEFSSSSEILEAMPNFLDWRLTNYMKKVVDRLPEGAGAAEILKALGEGYFFYCQEQPELYGYLFERYPALDDVQVCNMAKGAHTGNSGADFVVNVLKQLAQEQGAVVGEDIALGDIGRIALAIWSIIHGLSHLSTKGVVRFQHSVIRIANLRQTVQLVLEAIIDWFATKDIPERRPIMYSAREIVERAMGQWEDRPRVAPQSVESLEFEKAKDLIIETALQVAAREGVGRSFFKQVAQELNTTTDFLNSVIDNDFALREYAEERVTREMAEIFGKAIGSLPADTAIVDRLHVVASVYFNFSLRHTERFSAVIGLANGSIVPHSGDGSPHEGMTENFAIMMKLLREFIMEAGIQPTDQLVYLSALAMWAGADGVSHLCALGDFREYEDDLKWGLFSQALTSSFFAVAHGLQLVDKNLP